MEEETEEKKKSSSMLHIILSNISIKVPSYDKRYIFLKKNLKWPHKFECKIHSTQILSFKHLDLCGFKHRLG